MKAKKKRANLEAAKKWFDNLPRSVQEGLTRPGSVNQRTAVAS